MDSTKFIKLTVLILLLSALSVSSLIWTRPATPTTNVGNIITINLTSTSYTGNIAYGSYSGYEAGHNICNDEFGSNFYMCNEFEVDNYQRRYNISTISGVGWTISGSPKYAPADHPVNDCNGFTDNTTTSTSPLGSFWNFDAKLGVTGNCGASYPLTCCREG